MKFVGSVNLRYSYKRQHTLLTKKSATITDVPEDKNLNLSLKSVFGKIATSQKLLTSFDIVLKIAGYAITATIIYNERRTKQNGKFFAMFNENVKPKDVLSFTYKSLQSVMTRMIDLGFPATLTPPHVASVFLVLDPEDPNRIGIGRSEPTLLSQYEKNVWSSVGLFNLDVDSDENQIPIACFFGAVFKSSETDCLPKSEGSFFVGILLCPNGEEAVGCYAPIENLNDVQIFEEDPLGSKDFEFLYSSYIPFSECENEVH